MNRYCKYLCLLIFLVVLDISFKYWIKSCFYVGEVMCVIPGFNVCYVNNLGIAFGLFDNVNIYYHWMLLVFTVLIIIVFIISLYKSIKFYILYDSICYSMIIGGALGNLYDRILYGVVIDFIDLYIGTWHYPAFNVADIEIFLGVLFLTIKYVLLFNKYENEL